MSVSVVIPAWNAAATLAGTIRSALEHPEVAEVIVVDDGSTDDTASVARAFGQSVRVESIPNGGVSRARNLGVSRCSGDWVQFLDSDDQLLPGTLTQRLRSAGDADVIVTDWVEFVADADLAAIDGLRRGVADWSRVAADGAEVACATTFWAPPVAVLYRRSVVERIGGFRADLPVIQDARYLFDAARLGARFVHVPGVGAAYRVQPGSLSRRNPVAFLRDVLQNGLQIREAWLAEGPLSSQRRQVLAEIYSGAAEGLFNAADPGWRLACAETLALGSSRRLQTYRMLEALLGLPRAARLLAGLRAWRGI